MSTSCEIISPAVNSNIVRIHGSPPYNEGSNDKIEVVPERSSSIDGLAAILLVSPTLSQNTSIVPIVDKKIKNKYSTKSKKILNKNNIDSMRTIFKERNQKSTLNKISDKLFSKKGLVSEAIPRVKNENNFASLGISNDIETLESKLNLKSQQFFKFRNAIFKSPPNLDILDEMYLNENVTIEYYSRPSIISKNGLIEPLSIREISTFEFNEKSFKASLSINDVRRRSFFIKETIDYNDKKIEHFEDNIDVFDKTESSVVLNNFTEAYNSQTKKYSIQGIKGKVHNNKILDTSWISDDNAKMRHFEEFYVSIESEIDNSDYMTLNNNEILEYYTSNNIKVDNQYPKIFEDKYSTGYTYDRSKVQGLDSISFGGFLE